MVNGDGSELMVFLVTNKKLPEGYEVHTISLQERTWDKDEKKVIVEDVENRDIWNFDEIRIYLALFKYSRVKVSKSWGEV